MQRLQSNGLSGVRKHELQRALQRGLAQVKSGIDSAASIAPVRDFEQILQRGPPVTPNDLPAFLDALVNLHGTINDREFLLEKILTMMARLPDDSTFGDIVQELTISLLYKDLPHPPTGFLSTFHNVPLPIAEEPSVPYAFRSADGSNYNVFSPSLGQAGQPYARSVPATHINTSPLPDPGVVFDRLLRRCDDDFIPHPGGLSSLFFAFADLIIHTVFHTNASNWTINDSSSYLDMGFVYGNSVEKVKNMRKRDGTGKIWEDTFADSRLLLMPPSVCALAVLFSRHHNYIAQKILDLNEGGSFTSPPPSEPTHLLAQDDEIFHRARLVNTAFFMQIILSDYVGNILGLVRDGLSWRLDPLASYREPDHDVSPRGQGNAVSIEFNLLYRWHAAISEQDEKWLNETFAKLFGNKDPATVTVEEFRKVVQGLLTQPDAKTWTFDGLQRGSDGRFADEDLARLLQDATEYRAGAFRARGCPPALKLAEILAIQQGRKWGACTLNEFRKFFGLRPYQSFQEWNPNPIIHSAAEELYGHVDNLELHVGLQAEETKPPMPGAGLCPGYTISRAILADAVCLTRGDRFLTVDFTPYNLTSWGYQYCMVNPDDGSYGGMVGRLLFNLLPDQYPAGSVYAHFPFLTPDFVRPHIASHSTDLAYYDFSRPRHVEEGDRQLDMLYRSRILKLTKGVEVFSEVRGIIMAETSLVASFTKMFNTLVEKAAVAASQNTKVIDIVKDVISPASICWTANFVVGLPVTAFDNVLGGHTVARWYELFADVTRYTYLNDDLSRDWTMYQAALEATNEIIHPLRNRLKRHTEGTVSLPGATDLLETSLLTSNVQNDQFIAKVLASIKRGSVDTIAYSIFAEIVPSALLFSAAISSVVDYYADPSREGELQELVRLSTTEAGDGRDHALMKFISRALEAHQNSACREKVPDGSFPHDLTLGGQKVDVRDQGGLMSRELFAKLAPRVVAAVFSLKNVRFSGASMELDGGLPVSKIIQFEIDQLAKSKDSK